MTYPSFDVFKGCMEAIFAIEELRDKHFKESIEPYVNGHSVPTLGNSIAEGLVRMLINEFSDTKPSYLEWWLYETNRGVLVEDKTWLVDAVLTLDGKRTEIYTLKALYKLLTGEF